MLTTRDYRAIAAIIDKVQLIADPSRTNAAHVVKYIVSDLADYFVGDNPLFNRERFLTACGIEPEPEHLCEQCKTDMGSEWILGPVCGKCCRKSHKRACGG